jgi:hypothetical protein
MPGITGKRLAVLTDVIPENRLLIHHRTPDSPRGGVAVHETLVHNQTDVPLYSAYSVNEVNWSPQPLR